MRTLGSRRALLAALLSAASLALGPSAAAAPFGGRMERWGVSVGVGAEHRGFFQQSLFVRAGLVLPQRADRWLSDHGLSVRWTPEVFAGTIRNGSTSVEAGINGLLFQLDATWDRRWVPFAEGGFGLSYNDLHGAGLGGPFLFTNQGGVGIRYRLTETLALTGGYRFRHVSNAGMKDDNLGLDTHFLMLGVDFVRDPAR